MPNGLGNLTPQEMTRRFWEGMARGGYVGHGETYLHPQDILWWSKGGILHGESPQRIAFLRKVIEEMPGAWLEPVGEITNTHIPGAGIPGKYYLTYFGVRQPGEVTIYLPVEGEFLVDIPDTWEMTVTPVLGAFRQTTTIRLPAKPYIAIRIMRT